MHLIALPAFTDNYIWLLHHEQLAWVVDPGQAEPVLAALDRLGLSLQGILLTHHHGDHTGGVNALRQATGAKVYGPARESLPEPCVRLQEGDELMALTLRWRVMDVPGHTAGHIAWYAEVPDQDPILFCGDTLFSAGCGRLFEGTAAQMHDALSRLAALPDNTRVCCAHEYTLSNLAFAAAVEPDNPDVIVHTQRCLHLRAKDLPTLPSQMGLEKRINPFLRTECPNVQAAAMRYDPSQVTNPVGVLSTLRQWKNHF